jgi:hypothetical protein
MDCILLTLSKPLSNEMRKLQKNRTDGSYTKKHHTALFSHYALMFDLTDGVLFQFAFSSPCDFKKYFDAATEQKIYFGQNIIIDEPGLHLVQHDWTKKHGAYYDNVPIVKRILRVEPIPFMRNKISPTTMFINKTNRKVNIAIKQQIQDPFNQDGHQKTTFKLIGLNFTTDEMKTCDKMECVIQFNNKKLNINRGEFFKYILKNPSNAERSNLQHLLRI